MTFSSRRPTNSDGRQTVNAAYTQARADGEEVGRFAERSRISAILTSPEARTRWDLALDLALNSTMTSAEAREALKRAPAGGAKITAFRSPATSSLAENMAQRFAGQPKAGAGQPSPISSASGGTAGLVVAMRERFSKGQ